MYEPQHLERWTRPDCYFGATWPEYYGSGCGQHRDSDCLERSNFECMLNALGGESDTVHVVCENHWAVGWVEWIAIHQDDEKSLKIADDIQAKLADYPVIDEMHFSEIEWDEANETWRNCYNLRDRIELCANEGISIFAARRDYIPEGDSGRIFERCLGH